MHNFWKWICIGALALSACAWADPAEDAKSLKDEALQILKANATKEATPEEYANCIFKLERAQTLLETAGDDSSALAQEVGSSLFWARRFSNVKVLAALDVLKGQQPAAATPPKKAAPKVVAPPAKAAEGETPEMLRSRLAEAAFAAAQTFVGEHGKDDYAVALAWFKMASEHPGTDPALKALELARAAQLRFAGKKEVVEEVLPDTPEMALVKQGDEMAKQKKYEASFTLFEQSIKLKESLIAYRHMANAHFQRAQQIRDELKPKWTKNRADYQTAYQNSWVKNNAGQRFYNPDSAAMGAWKRETAGLQKESDVANKNFEDAERAFAKVIKLAPESKDFEAAGYMGLCIGVRPFFRMKGVTTLESFIKDYAPANDVQRSLYEFCKSEIDRLKKGG